MMNTRVPEPLPKIGSGAFKALCEQVLRVLDLPRLVLVIEGALDRRAMEEVLRKSMKGGALRPGVLARPELVAAVAKAMVGQPDAAWLAMRALDKSCSKERFIVASIDDEHVDMRLSSYRALDFRRERARLIWALVRDGREGHVRAAERVMKEAFDAIEAAQQTAETLAGGSDAPAAEPLERIRAQLETYEAALHEQGEILQQQIGEKETIERERSSLLAKLGVRERALKDEQERRRTTEDELKRLRGEMRELRAELDHSSQAQLRDAIAERDRFRERARTLEKQTERLSRLHDLAAENAALQAELESYRRSESQWRAEHERLVRQLISRERAALERVSSLRDSLKTARKLSATPSDPSWVEGEPVQERVGVFIDAANLAASARRERQGKFDFVSLLPLVVAERRRSMAIAFVVNNDEDERDGNFLGFARSLLAAGYELRQKRPRIRSDGSRKADWDMGIAMEIIDARNRLDVIVLGSGDGDFLPLVGRLRKWGKRVEVASFRASTDPALIRAADEFYALDDKFVLRE